MSKKNMSKKNMTREQEKAMFAKREQGKKYHRRNKYGKDYDDKIQVKKISIMRAEGPSRDPDVGTWRHFDNYHDADKYLRKQSRTAPDSGGYDKHDFKVEWKDGHKYEGRLDVKRNGEDTDVGKHIEEHCKYLSTAEFDWLSKKEQADMKKQGQETLKRYSLNDKTEKTTYSPRKKEDIPHEPIMGGPEYFDDEELETAQYRETIG